MLSKIMKYTASKQTLLVITVSLYLQKHHFINNLAQLSSDISIKYHKVNFGKPLRLVPNFPLVSIPYSKQFILELPYSLK